MYGIPDSYPAASCPPQICIICVRYRIVSVNASCFSARTETKSRRIIFLSILGQHKLYATLSNFLGIVGYWAGDLHTLSLFISTLTTGTSLGAWLSAICVEHLYFRRGDFALYDLQYWDVPSRLPLGVAALGASVLSFALVIPSMSQVWYKGPIASKTGDIGFEAAMVVTALCYIPLRHLEKRWRGV